MTRGSGSREQGPGGVLALCLLLAGLWALGPPWLWATRTSTQQQDPRTFRAGTNLVTVDVTVLDREGVPVRGLDAGDFTVELNGQARLVRVVDYVEFERLDAPLEIAPGREIAPPTGATQEPRVTVLLLDDLSFDTQDAKGIMSSASRFMASLRPNDLVGFATTTGEGPLVNPSRDHAPVLDALSRSIGRLGIDLDFTCPASLEEFQCSCIASFYDLVARTQLENFESVALSLGAAPVGRTLVILTKGIAPTLICGVPATGWEGGLVRERDVSSIQPFAQAVARAGVATYIVTVEPDPAFDPVVTEPWFNSARLVADVSGATFERVIGQADRVFTRIRTAMSAYYRLGVELPPDALDARVTVSVAVDRDDVRVESRRSAMVPDGVRPDMTIDEALQAAAVRGEYWRDVPVEIAVAARQSATAGQLQLGLHLTVPSDVAGPLTSVIAVIDDAGAVAWTGRAELPMPDEEGEDYVRSTTVDVPPGRYRVRVAVADAGERLGVADRAVTAALHDMGGLAVSDIFTSWAGSTDRYRFTLDRLPAEAELLHAEIEFYAATEAAASDVLVHWILASGDATEPWVERESDVFPENGTLKAITELPVDDLPPGLYTLRARVTRDNAELGTITAAFTRLRRD